MFIVLHLLHLTSVKPPLFAVRKKSDDAPLNKPLVHAPLVVNSLRGPAPFWSAYDAGDALAAVTTPSGQLATPSDSLESLREVEGTLADTSGVLPIRVQPLRPTSPVPLASSQSFAAVQAPDEQRPLGVTMSAEELQLLKTRRKKQRKDKAKKDKLNPSTTRTHLTTPTMPPCEALQGKLKPLSGFRCSKQSNNPVSTPTAFQQASEEGISTATNPK